MRTLRTTVQKVGRLKLELVFPRSFCYSVQLLQSVEEPPRINQLGIQYLSEGLHRKVFPKTSPRDYLDLGNNTLLELAKKHLDQNGLLGKKTQITKPINIEHFPELVGRNTLDEHFYKIGIRSSQQYLQMADSFLSPEVSLPPKPSNWIFRLGWTRYAPDEDPKPVPYPTEDSLVFDVEVIYKKSPYAVICTCASEKAWYGWVSPFLVNYANDKSYDDWEHLIPFNCLMNPKLLIGYNVSYDRARVLDEYNIKQSKGFYLDSMALHVAISGICSQQRPTWHKHKKSKSQLEDDMEEFDLDKNDDIVSYSIAELAQELSDDPWLSKGSPNSLANVAEFHCGIQMDKTDRDYFSTEDPMEIIHNFNKLMDYCSKDVEATFIVTKKLLPIFKNKVPHPVSFAALRHLGALMLPTTKKWDSYIETAEKKYQENREEVTEILKSRANELVRFIEDKNTPEPNWIEDEWLSQLNWSLKEVRLRKDGTPVTKQAYLTGYPEWYRDLFKTITIDGAKRREMNISVRTRITPLLLKLKWEGYPLFWTDSIGWCFKVPYNEEVFEDLESKNYKKVQLNEDEYMKYIDSLHKEGKIYQLFKIPHPDGPGKRCSSIMSKNYLKYFENGTLTSEYNYAQEILSLNSTASYWMGNRNRISEQFVVYSNPKKNSFFNTKKQNLEYGDMGIILPKLCTMGTITRRATENTWLTASNAKSNRIGSELKAMIEAPKGYVFVGADVDSEELWIASLVGDSMFKIHGGTALGWMTLEGDKNEKTDLHSKTAEILGISRNDAKVFNYGRIYGAGVKFASRLLKQCNSKLSDDEAAAIAKNLYIKTKGHSSSSKILKGRLYHGGSESVMFNALEAIACQDDPRTPVLGAAITDALTIGNLNKNNYLTSRINWAIQSSGVDYLHLLIISMEYLTGKYQVDARLMITVHDEVRYLVKEQDKYKAALLLQISNLWTRAMFCEQLGIKEVPQSCAFFSEVDIDYVLRKEVDLNCVTPSHPTSLAPGESLRIDKLLEICENGRILDSSSSKNLMMSNIKYKKRETVISKLAKDNDERIKLQKIRLENSVDKHAWRKNMNELIKMKEEILKTSLGSSSRKDTKLSLTRRKKKIEDIDISRNGNKELANEIYSSTSSTKPTKTAKSKEYIPFYVRANQITDSKIYNQGKSLKTNVLQPSKLNITKFHSNLISDHGFYNKEQSKSNLITNQQHLSYKTSNQTEIDKETNTWKKVGPPPKRRRVFLQD